MFARLNQRYPHGACLLGDGKGWILLEQLNNIALGSDCARCGEYANMFRLCALWNDLNSRANDS